MFYMPRARAITPKTVRGPLERKRDKIAARYSVGLSSPIAREVERYAKTVDTSVSKAITALVRRGLENQESRKREFFKRLKETSPMTIRLRKIEPSMSSVRAFLGIEEDLLPDEDWCNVFGTFEPCGGGKRQAALIRARCAPPLFAIMVGSSPAIPCEAISISRLDAWTGCSHHDPVPYV